MNQLWFSGFRLNTLNEWSERLDADGTIQTSVVQSGTYALQVTGFTSGHSKGLGQAFTDVKNSGSDRNGPLFFRIYFRADTLPSAENTVFALCQYDDTVMVRLTIDNAGALRLYDTTGQIGSASSALSTSTWYYLEVNVDRTGSSGSHVVRAKVNGTQFAGASNRSVSAGISLLHIGANLNGESQTTGNFYFDDVAISDDAYPGAYTPSSTDYALYFDGTNDKATIATNNYDGLSTGTIEFWFYTNYAAGYQKIMQNFGSIDIGIAQDFGSGAQVFTEIQGVANVGNFSPSCADGNWHHVAITWDGTNIYTFYDGVLKTTTAQSGTQAHTTNTLNIGSTGSSEYFKGGLDEIRISNIARYTATFTRPTQKFTSDANTLLLLHADEGTGSTSSDASSHSNTLTLDATNPPAWHDNTPSLSAGANASFSASVLSVVASMPAATVTAKRAVTISPAAQSVVSSLPSRTITAKRTVNVAATVFSGVLSLPARTITTIRSVTITPSALSAVFSHPTSSVATNNSASVAVATQSAIFMIPSPTVTAKRTVSTAVPMLGMVASTPLSIVHAIRSVMVTPAVRQLTFSLPTPSVGSQYAALVHASVLVLHFVTIAPSVHTSGSTPVSPFGYKPVKDAIVATLQGVGSLKAVYGKEEKAPIDFPAACVSAKGHSGELHDTVSNRKHYQHVVRVYFRTDEEHDADYEDVLEAVADDVTTALEHNLTLNGVANWALPLAGVWGYAEKQTPVRYVEFTVQSEARVIR